MGEIVPSLDQWETVKQQCSAFNESGYIVKCEMQSQMNEADPAIRISKGLKTWHFSDPDWNRVIAQLAQLWKVLHVKEREKH